MLATAHYTYCYPGPSLNYCNSLYIGFPDFQPLLSKVSSPLSQLSISFKIYQFLKIFFAYTCGSFPFHSIKGNIPKVTSIYLQDLALATLPLSLHFLPLTSLFTLPQSVTCLCFLTDIRHALASVFCSCFSLCMKFSGLNDLLG